MTARRSRLFLAVLLSVGVALAAGAWALFLRPVRVETIEAQRNVPVQVFGLGTVEARVVSKVGFKISGVLTDLGADEGDRVAKDMILARLDTREQAARVSRAKANVVEADANLQKAIATVAKGRTTYDYEKSVNKRRQALVRKGILSIEEADAAKAKSDVALADLKVADSDVLVARAAARSARAEEELERVMLDFHTLRAPYDALVIARQRELGSALAAGEPVFTLIDSQSVWVLAYIDESKAGEIRVGQPAEILLRSLPNRPFEGHVIRIEIESDRVNEERRIEVAFVRLPDDFHIGEQAEVYVTTTVLARALLVPEAAVEEFKGNRGTVWTVEDGRLGQREVALGHRTLDGRFEILGGIPDGALVLARLSGSLRVGRAAKSVGKAAR